MKIMKPSENDHLLDKAVLKDRIKNTRLLPSNNNFILESWEPDDDHRPVNYAFAATIFGEMLIASTGKGICYIGFTNQGRVAALADVRKRFARNMLVEKPSRWQADAVGRMNDPLLDIPLHLHLRGTAFQLKIWEKLMRIPFGGLTTYTELGGGGSNARATGGAVGANPVSFLLACHRVVRSDGSFEGYHWGNEVKRDLLKYEAQRLNRLFMSA